MGANVVVVDDDDDIALLLLTALQRASISAIRARDGVEGVAAVRSEHPSVVLLDWMMPVKDGIQACVEIRDDTTLSQPHIIMLTARVDSDDHQYALQTGVNEIITKPFRPREIVTKIKEYLGASTDEPSESP